MQLQCIAFLSCAVHLLARIPRPVCSILAGTMPEEDAGTEGLNVLVTLLIDESLPICRHLECVRYLLLEDADPFLVDRAHLRTALHCAAAYGHADVMAVLLEDDLVVSYCLLASFSGCCGAQNVLCRCVPLKFKGADIRRCCWRTASWWAGFARALQGMKTYVQIRTIDV